MIRYVSTRGAISPVDFETAVLQGFAEDGGLFVPERIPKISSSELKEWSALPFKDLAFQIVSPFIDRSILPAEDLRRLINTSFETFSHPEIIPVVPLGRDVHHLAMELFHGPTLSFKDVAMGFLINVMDYFLQRRGETVSLLIATTGDTGPAAAYASCGKKTVDCWVMYPRKFISKEQERQMTTLGASNVHAVAVENCPEGGDNLDIVIAQMFDDKDLAKKLHLSSVNSINWCRVMFQCVHYFHAYFQAAKQPGDRVAFSVPTGAFGNLFAGYLAREMGLPVASFICANNRNATVHRIVETSRFSRESVKKTPSNAIDIALPYNFWRFLYFVSGRNSGAVKRWMSDYQESGFVEFDETMMQGITNGFLTAAVSDEETLSTIADIYGATEGYLLDPHGAVAVAAARKLYPRLPPETRVVSLLTAHPAKFPDITCRALKNIGSLPPAGRHEAIEKVKNQFQQVKLCDCSQLREALIHGLIQQSFKVRYRRHEPFAHENREKNK